MNNKIGFLGPEGTYTGLAANIWQKRINNSSELLAINTIPSLMQSVAEENVDYGIVPLENSIEGTVNITIDTLLKSDVKIVGEIVIKIDHCLAAQHLSPKEHLQVVFSHPQALSQCSSYIAANLPHVKIVSTDSTGEAARLVSEGPKFWAAICSKQAAAYNHLKTIDENIQDYPDNKTRFLVLSNKSSVNALSNKTTIVIALPENKPGGLYKVLKEFADQEINLTKIESRPTKKELGEYLFYIDCIGHVKDQNLATVLANLTSQAVFLKVLGSYPIDDEGY